MNKRADTIRVSQFLLVEFSICTFDPKRLAQFARDLLEKGVGSTAGNPHLKESLERVSKW